MKECCLHVETILLGHNFVVLSLTFGDVCSIAAGISNFFKKNTGRNSLERDASAKDIAEKKADKEEGLTLL